MVINSTLEIGLVVAEFALMGLIIIGALLGALHLDRWHPKLIGAAIGAVIGIVLIETVPMLA
jgi:hypothetical protein